MGKAVGLGAITKNFIREERWDPSYESVPPTSNDSLAFSFLCRDFCGVQCLKIEKKCFLL